jgi:hypothetical protein
MLPNVPSISRFVLFIFLLCCFGCNAGKNDETATAATGFSQSLAKVRAMRCPAGKFCLVLQIRGLVGVLKENNTLTAFFVDADYPILPSADDLPVGANLGNLSQFPRHSVKLRVVSGGRLREKNAAGNTVKDCTAVPGTPCERLSRKNGIKDLELSLVHKTSTDPPVFAANSIDTSGLLDEAILENACGLAADVKYFKIRRAPFANNKFVEAQLYLDRGTSISPIECGSLPEYKLSKVNGTQCAGIWIFAEGLEYFWVSGSSDFTFRSAVTGSTFVISPAPGREIAYASLTNEISTSSPMRHEAPFRWLYRLTINDMLANHYFLNEVTPCDLLGSKCPVLLLDP